MLLINAAPEWRERSVGIFRIGLENLLLDFKAITGAQFKTLAQDSAHYEEVGAWLQASGTPKRRQKLNCDRMKRRRPAS